MPATDGPHEELCAAAAARYVRLRMTGTARFLNLAEVEVYSPAGGGGLATVISGVDRPTCCMAKNATCGDRYRAGAGTPNAVAVTDADCGAGYFFNTSTSANICSAGTTCDASGDDRATCCVALGSCGDKDGVGAGTAPVSDADCGDGYIYDPSKSAVSCAGATCDAGGLDRGTCCKALSDMGSLNNHTCLSLWTNKKVNFR